MEFYTWLDFISGFGCLVFAVAYASRRASFHPERRLIFLFAVLGGGFLLRGWADRDGGPASHLAERLAFSCFPLAATLYIEQMARLRLPIAFKLFVLAMMPITWTSFAIFGREPRVYPLVILFSYEMITLAALIAFTLRKTLSLPPGVERSISSAVLAFLVAGTGMIGLDWWFQHSLGLPRASSLVVFPFCYFAFMVSFGARGFSNRRSWRDALLEVGLALVQALIVYGIWDGLPPRSYVMLAVLFLDVRITLRSLSMIANRTEDRRALFTLAQINALSRESPDAFMERLLAIDNVELARFIEEEEFAKFGLPEVYRTLFDTHVPCSREEIVRNRLDLVDEPDLHGAARMQYALDAFRMDFLYAVPGSRVCFGIRFRNYNQDAGLSERAYAIFTQASLMLARAGVRNG